MKRAAPPEPPPAACANCGRAFETPLPNFCPACGQESRVRAPRLMEFLQQFGGAYFSTEGALWRTLKLLLTKPGELTRQYLAGRRKHYVLPLRLYLTISLLALLLLRALANTSLGVGIPADLDLRKGEYTIFSFGDGSGAGMKDGQYYCKDLPAWLCKRLERRLNNDPKGLQREAEAVGERFVSNMGAAMFLMLPLFALWQKLVYWNRRLHYTEHLVFALHLHAFWFLALMLTLFDQPWLTGLAVVAVPVYALLALKRVYGGRWFWLLLRASIVSMLYGLALSFVLAGAIMWSLIF
jgi:Protein of unknown function (DUF3667)